MRWISLLIAFQQALWIDVPFVQQDKNGCGSASIWMVMEHWKAGSAPSVDEIQQKIYSKSAEGIFARDMVRYFEEHSYRALAFRGEWVDLEQHIAKGRPLIVCLESNARGVPLHYVVVAGVDSIQNLVLVNDPAQRKLLSMSRTDFERSWRATDNWTLLALPEVDLASNAFRQDNLPEAQLHLRSALRTNPRDEYLNNFLGTVFFLQNNNEAALKYWNRAAKPEIENIQIDPPLRINPVLLDRSFAFSRGSVLNLDDFETTKARLDALRVFSRYQIELSPSNGERFDLKLHAAERNGASILSWFRGLPFQTVQPELSNLGGKALNLGSLVRWDSNKRRAAVFLETPLRENPKWSIRLAADARHENWADSTQDFRLRKIQFAADLRSVPSGRWSWTSGAALSNRRFSNSFQSGIELKYAASIKRVLVSEPDKKLKIDALAVFETGKLFSEGKLRYTKADGTLSVKWHRVTSQMRVGRAFGGLPFDERYVLGLERDSDLWLRGHLATVDGRKNASNTTASFATANSDFQNQLVNIGWLRLTAGPFLDVAKSSLSANWMADSGLEIRFSVLGALAMNFSYGRSLSDGHHAFFISNPK